MNSKCTIDDLAREKNNTKKVFLELYNELAAIFKYPIMKQLRVTVSACGVKT